MNQLQLVALLISSLLASIPRVPQPQRGRIEARREQIIQMVAESTETHGIPPAVLLAVGMMETHWGVDTGEGGNWGAPRSMRTRHLAGTADHAARALARSYVVCGRTSWRMAVTRFRYGNCRDARAATGYVPTVMRIIAQTHRRAGLDLPADMR